MDDPRPDDTAAAELALGLLDGEDRAAALRRMLAEPGFAQAVEDWRLRFAQLFDLWPEVAAPDDLIDRIDASLDGAVVRPARRLPWPALALVSSAVAAALLVFVVVRQPPAQPVPAPGAERLLAAAIGGAAASVPAVFDPARATLRIASGPAVPAARVAQLWIIGTNGTPHPVALLNERAQVVVLSGGDRQRIAAGATLAISVEPAGGSPTGLPTGPVVAKGVVALL